MTEKLYYSDSYIKKFSARVVACAQREDKSFEVVLDRTAFFPTGGGQNADRGFIGDASVLDVIERDEIIHVVNSPLVIGAEYECSIDWDNKLRNLQNHSGEHIVSGIICSKYGLDNVGFHLGRDEVTLDFSGYVDEEGLTEVERIANEAVISNIKIKAEVVGKEESAKLTYRSKIEINDNIRIVTIEGYDSCACCAPHLRYTGEIGQIKILDSMRYKGGVRIWIACGFDALKNHNEKHSAVKEISRMLSQKQNEVVLGVTRLFDTIDEKNAKISSLKEELLHLKLSSLEYCSGNRLVFETEADMNFMRLYANSAVKLCDGIFGIFGGDDEAGYKYILASEKIDLKARAKEINQALAGNGGGNVTMIQGSVSAKREEIEKYFAVN